MSYFIPAHRKSQLLCEELVFVHRWLQIKLLLSYCTIILILESILIGYILRTKLYFCFHSIRINLSHFIKSNKVSENGITHKNIFLYARYYLMGALITHFVKNWPNVWRGVWSNIWPYFGHILTRLPDQQILLHWA